MQRKNEWFSLLGLALGVIAGGCFAQAKQPSQDDLKAKYEAKLQEAWFVDGGWSVDFAGAKERAKKENKVVFAYFSRSYSP